MTELRLKWEPESLVPLNLLEERLMTYTNGKGGVTLLQNGTVLFIKSSGDDVCDARKSMDEAEFLTDFEIQPMKDGDYLVIFHQAVAVFISSVEFEQCKDEIIKRVEDLKFPSEEFMFDPNNQKDNLLLGLYARGKLQKDAHEFRFYKRL